MELEGTKTKANLIAAFAGESQASVKYQLYGYNSKEKDFSALCGSLPRLPESKSRGRNGD